MDDFVPSRDRMARQTSTRSFSVDSGKPRSLPMKRTNKSTSLPTIIQNDQFMRREIVAAFYTAKLFLPKLSQGKILYYAQLLFQYYQFAVPLIDYGTDCTNAGTDMIFSFRRQKKFIG